MDRDDQNSLRSFFNYLLKFKNEKNLAALDFCHDMLLFGSVLSKKPEEILELGIGTGYSSRAILAGIKYNRRGRLTCVDNWVD